MGVGGEHHALADLSPGKRPILEETGWALLQGRTDTDNLATTGVRTQDLPAHGESLYQLCYRSRLLLFREV
jgi:hypothetical protein